MKKLLLLTVIIVIKVISTKAIALLNVLLSFVIKGKQFTSLLLYYLHF